MLLLTGRCKQGKADTEQLLMGLCQSFSKGDVARPEENPLKPNVFRNPWMTEEGIRVSVLEDEMSWARFAHKSPSREQD